MDQRAPAPRAGENARPGNPILTSRDKKWLAAMVCLLAAFGAWALFQEREPSIDPDSPAAQLLRDDAARQEAARAELEAARTGGGTAKEPRLFVRIKAEEASGDGEWRLRFTSEMDYTRCVDYSGDADQCRVLRDKFSFSKDNIHTDHPLKGSVKTDRGYWSPIALYSLPLKDVPARKKVRFSLAGLPEWVKPDVVSFERTLPEWTVNARFFGSSG